MRPGRTPLVVHPNYQIDAVTRGSILAMRWDSMIAVHFNFVCRRPDIVLPEPAGQRDGNGFFPNAPMDEPSPSTSFSIFVRLATGGPAYFEFNFTPAMRWMVHRFSDRGDRPRKVALGAPPQLWESKSLEDCTYCASFELDSSWAERTWYLGAGAVLEEKGGAKSIWALAHKDGAPDFHDPDSFTLKIGPKDH